MSSYPQSHKCVLNSKSIIERTKESLLRQPPFGARLELDFALALGPPSITTCCKPCRQFATCSISIFGLAVPWLSWKWSESNRHSSFEIPKTEQNPQDPK
eukprot:2306029-Amphidinium_carterae.2